MRGDAPMDATKGGLLGALFARASKPCGGPACSVATDDAQTGALDTMAVRFRWLPEHRSQHRRAPPTTRGHRPLSTSILRGDCDGSHGRSPLAEGVSSLFHDCLLAVPLVVQGQASASCERP